MSNRGKFLFAIFGLMFLALIIWVVQTTPNEPPPTEKISPPKVMEYEGNILSEEVNGVKVWDLTAEHMVVDVETQNAELNNLIGHFYQQDGSSIEIKANYGTVENDSKNIHIEGDVIATTSEGAKLSSDKMDWQNKEGTLTAMGKIKLTKDDIMATGDIAESKDGFKHFLLKGHAHIIKGIKDKQ